MTHQDHGSIQVKLIQGQQDQDIPYFCGSDRKMHLAFQKPAIIIPDPPAYQRMGDA
jgi:hypothetical protein